MNDSTSMNTRPTADDEQGRLARRLREAREYLGLSQELVAERLGVPRASVSAIETSKRKVNSLELKQLARLYGQSLSYFLEEDTTGELANDQTVSALFRAARGLTAQDREQVLRFAQFLRESGRAPTIASAITASEGEPSLSDDSHGTAVR